MDEDNKMAEPGPSTGCSNDRSGIPVCTTHHRDIIPPSRPRDEGSDSEYGVRRSISCEQLATWNSQLYEKNYVICPLPNCGLMFHGAPQIQNHYVNCTGRYDGAVLKCVHCQAVVAADHMYQHMKAMHHSEPSPHLSSDSGSSEVARVTGIIEGGGRSNQKSGRFLLGSVAVPPGASTIVSDDEDGRDFHRYSIYGISKGCPPASMCNQEQLERQWSQEIATTGCATCPIEGCHLNFPTVNSISLHFQHCCRSPKPHEYVVCELCNKKFASLPVLNDHIYRIHEESRQKIRIRNLDNSVPDYSLRRCVISGREEVERRRVTDAPQMFHPLPVEEDVNLQSDSDHHCKQREVYVRSAAASESDSSLGECYIPQHHGSRPQYHLTKNQGHPRESVNAGPSTYNSPTVLHSYHSTSKQSRHVEFEKHKLHEDVNMFGNTSAFHRVRDRGGSEHLITVPFGTESKEPSRFLYEGSNSLYGRDDSREHLTSGSPCCRSLSQSVRTSFMRKSGNGSPVYPTTSGVKRKYVEQHSYGNVYESHKNRKCGPKVSYNTGYTSDESEEDGRPVQNHEPRIRHSPGMRPYPRSCIKAETYPPAGRSLRRGQTPPFPGHSEKESIPVFERHGLPDESYFDPNGILPTVTGCVWEEEEEGLFTAPVHIKKRQLAERAQQLQRAEEAVKQQEEEAQERTWRALHEQEMALREKEEALKQREAVAQKKIEEATRLIEESRKLGDSKKFKDEKCFLNTRPANLHNTNKRSSSSGPFHSCQEMSNQISTNDVHDDVMKCPDTSLELGGTNSLLTNDSETPVIPCTSYSEVPVKMGRISNEFSLTKIALANSMQQRQGESHSVISSSIEKSLSLQNLSETSSQGHNTDEMEAPPKCNLEGKSGGSKDRNVHLWELNETIPRIEPSKVIKTYSRANRCRTVKESSDTLALSYIQTKACIPPRAHSVAPITKTSVPTLSIMTSPENSSETVVNEGATVTITPLSTAERPPRPCSAMPNLQPSGHGGTSDSCLIPRAHPSLSSVSKLTLPVTVTVMLESHHKPSSSLTRSDSLSESKESPCQLSMQPITPLRIIQTRKTLISRNTPKILPASAPLQEVTQTLQQLQSKQNTVKYPGKAKPCITVTSSGKGRKLSMMTLAGISISGHEKKDQLSDAADESTLVVMKCNKSPTEVDFSSQNTSPLPCPMYVMCNSQENAASTRYKSLNVKSGLSHHNLSHLSTTTRKKFLDLSDLGAQEPSEETVKVKAFESNSSSKECIKNVTKRPLFHSVQNKQNGTSLPSHNISPIPFSVSLSNNEASSSSEQESHSVQHPSPQHVSLSPCLVSAVSPDALPTSPSSLISRSLLLAPHPAKPIAESASPTAPLAIAAAKSTSTPCPAKPAANSSLPTHHTEKPTAKSAPPALEPALLTPHSMSPSPQILSPTPSSASPAMCSAPLTLYPTSSIVQPELVMSHPESSAAHQTLSASHLTSLAPHQISPSLHPAPPALHQAPLAPNPPSPTPHPKSLDHEALSQILNPKTPKLCSPPILHPASAAQHPASPASYPASLTFHPTSPVPHQTSSTPPSVLPVIHPTSPPHHSASLPSHPSSPVPHTAVVTPQSSSQTLTSDSQVPYTTSLETCPASPVSNRTSASHPESPALCPASPTPHSETLTSDPPSLEIHQTSLTPTLHSASSPLRSASPVPHPASLKPHQASTLHQAPQILNKVSSAPESSSQLPYLKSPLPHPVLLTSQPSSPTHHPVPLPPNSLVLTSDPAVPTHHATSPTSQPVSPVPHAALLVPHPSLPSPCPPSLITNPASPTPNSASAALHTSSPALHPVSPASCRASPTPDSALPSPHPASTRHPTSPLPDQPQPKSHPGSSASFPASPLPPVASLTSQQTSLTPKPTSSPPHSTSPASHPGSASYPASPASLTPNPASSPPHSPSPSLHPGSPTSYPASPASYPASPLPHTTSPTTHASLTLHSLSSVSDSKSLMCHTAEFPLSQSRVSSTVLSTSSSHPDSPTLHRSLLTSHSESPVPYCSPLTHPPLPKPHLALSAPHPSLSVPISASLASLPTSPVDYPLSVTQQQESSYQESVTPHLLPSTPHLSSTPCPPSQSAVHHSLPICCPSSSPASYQVPPSPNLTSAPYHETLPPPLQASLPVPHGTSPVSPPTMAESHQSPFVPHQILTASVDSQEPEKQVALISNCEVSSPSMISRVSCPDSLIDNETLPRSQVQEIQVPQQSEVILQHVTQGPQPTARLTKGHSHQQVIHSCHAETQVTSQATVMMQEVMQLSQQGSPVADQLPSDTTNYGLNGTELAEPQILGEYDPLTGTFTSNNPAFLQSILNSSINFPTRCLPDNNSSKSVTGSLTSHSSSMTPVRRVSVQIQTEDFHESVDKIEVLSFSQKGEDNKNYVNENQRAENMLHHLMKKKELKIRRSDVKQQFLNIKDENVVCRHHTARTSTTIEPSDTCVTESENVEQISAKSESLSSVDSRYPSVHKQETCGNVENNCKSAVLEQNSTDSEEAQLDFQITADEIDHETQYKNAGSGIKNYMTAEVSNAELDHEKVSRKELSCRPVNNVDEKNTSDVWVDDSSLTEATVVEANARKLVILENASGEHWMNQTVRNEASAVAISDCLFDEKERNIDTKVNYGLPLKEKGTGPESCGSAKKRHITETNLKDDINLSSDANKAVMLTNIGVKMYSDMVPGMLNQNTSSEFVKQVKESETVLHADRKENVMVYCTSEVNLDENQDLLKSEVGKITGKNKKRKVGYDKLNYGSLEMQNDNVQECQATGFSNDVSHNENKADMVSRFEPADVSAENLQADMQEYELIKVTSKETGSEEDRVRDKGKVSIGRGKRRWLDTYISSVHCKSDLVETNPEEEKVCSFRIDNDENMLDPSLTGKMEKTDEAASFVQKISLQENHDVGHTFQDKSLSLLKEGKAREVLSMSTDDCPLSPLVGGGIAEYTEGFENCSKKARKNFERQFVKSAVKVEKPEVEEKVERVSRGGRKLKLKDWWTGVVTDATSRSKTCNGSKSPIRPSIKTVKYKDVSARHCSFKKDLTESSNIGENLKNKEKLGYALCQPTDKVKRDDNLWYSREITGDNGASMLIDESDSTGVPLPDLDETQETEVAVEERILPAACDVKSVRKRKGRPRASHPKDQIDTELSSQPEEVKCGNCGLLCDSQGHFISHAQLEHNGLARPDGENQDFTEDEIKYLLNTTIKAVKRLKCMKCFSEFRSLLGYRRHVLVCGMNSEELNVTCKICFRQVRYYYLDLHIKRNHCERQEAKKIEKQDESRKGDDQTVSGLRPRRKAAANCNARLQVWRSNRTGECGSDVSDGEDDYHKELNLSQFYSKPEPTIPEEYSKKWEADLAFHGKAVCINEGCTYTFTEVGKGHEHIWNCPFTTTDKTYRCRICESTSFTEDDIVNHIALNHTDMIAGSFEGSDCDISDDDYEGPRKVQKSYGSTAGLQLKPFSSALNWTLEFLNGTVSEKLFSEFYVLRDNWNALQEQVARKYLPSIRYSPKFKIQMVTKEGSKSVQEWQELNQLHGIAQEKGYAMFCGGPVTASAWCPQPLSFSSNSVQQYLAVSSVSSPEKKYHVHKSSYHDGLIQIWDCSCLGENSKEPPKFLFGIAHEFGNVWSLVWCPSGTFEFDDDNNPQEDDTLSRLGLLAAACSDGTVRIFAIPQPRKLNLLDSSRIYKALPKVTLSPGEMYKDEAQCLKVDWCRGKGHAYVAGALSTGVVCVWDVNCTSPLLRVKDIQGNFTLYPVNSFLAHNGVCSVVAFCPTTGGRNLLSGGSDRTYKFWDLENTDMPLSITRKGLVLDAVWLPHWAGCFISFDDVYGLTNTNTCFRENGFFGIQSRNVLSSNAPVWSLAGSDWLNAIIQGDSAGEVMITVQQQLFRNYENDKFPSKRKVPLLSVRMQNFDKTSPVSFRVCLDSKQLSPSETSKTKPLKKHKKLRQGQGEKDSLEEDGLCPAAFVEWPRSYFETCQNYGIVFFDQDCENFSQIPEAELTERKRSDYMEPGPVACYPMMAATSIAWNNNISAHTWIFVGTHSGLGRLLNIKALTTPEEEK
ncbi:LOW QUALITY PROTEIN: uncharacterized protein [Panulirus ornatus]|uniref:LOW QUALITY PROTEIN: uncharacterized protein n=1 Tax=Panulirus ornatus TaxID=150431 RepID=UPI003A87622F